MTLVSVCFYIPKNIEPTFHVLCKTPDNTPIPAPNGREWVTACNAPKKPRVGTATPEAVTCYYCLQWIEKRNKYMNEQAEKEALAKIMASVEIIDEDNPENNQIPVSTEPSAKLSQSKAINSMTMQEFLEWSNNQIPSPEPIKKNLHSPGEVQF